MWIAMLSPSSVGGDTLGDLRELIEDIEENPALIAAATFRSMDRLRDALLLIEETAAVETPVPLLLQDVILLGRQLLQHLRCWPGAVHHESRGLIRICWRPINRMGFIGFNGLAGRPRTRSDVLAPAPPTGPEKPQHCEAQNGYFFGGWRSSLLGGLGDYPDGSGHDTYERSRFFRELLGGACFPGFLWASWRSSVLAT